MQTVPFLRAFSAYAAARDDFLLVLEQEGRAPSTLKKYRHAIARLAGYAGEVDPATIDAALLRRWVLQLRQEGLRDSTQGYYLGWVKTWLRWLEAEGGYGVSTASAARAKPPRVVERTIVPFTEAECARLLAVGTPATFRGQRLRAIVATLLDTGLRAGEICGLRLCDLDLAEGDLTVIPSTDKTRKGRTIGLGRRAKVELSRWWSRYRYTDRWDCAPTAPVFVMENGLAYKKRSFQWLLTRLGTRANVQHVHPHRFRHTFAILSLRHGMDPWTLQHTLGHTDMAMTKRYLHLVETDVREKKRASSPLDRLKL